MLLVLTHELFLLLAMAFLLGLFTRGTTPVVSTLFSQVSHSNHYEKVFGISETFLSITATIAPAVMGIIADRTGISAVFYTASFLATLAVIPVILLPKET